MTNVWKSTFDLKSPDLIDALDELPFWSAPFGIRLLDTVILKKGITALDIGFGTGFPLIELASRLGNSSTVYGIDPWPAAIQRAEKKIRQFGITHINLLEGEAEAIPLEDQSVDLVVSNNGINNVGDMEQVIKECYRVMKSEAQFVLTMNLNTTMIEFYDLFEDLLAEKGMNQEIKKMEEHIYARRKPLDEIQQMLIQNGFIIRQTLHDRFNYTFADGTAVFGHHDFRISFIDGWKSIVDKAVQDEIFEELESRMNKIALQQGHFELRIPFVTLDCVKRD